MEFDDSYDYNDNSIDDELNAALTNIRPNKRDEIVDELPAF